MAALPDSSHRRGPRYRLVFNGTAPETLRKTVCQPFQPGTDPAARLIEDALSWAAQCGLEEPNTTERRHAVWSCARDVIGHVLEIEDPDFCQDPPLLRYRWAVDGVSDEDSMREWVGSRPEWRQALERYCAERRREALTAIAQRTRGEPINPTPTRPFM